MRGEVHYLLWEKPHPRAVAGAVVIPLGPRPSVRVLLTISAPVRSVLLAIAVGKVHSLKPVEGAGSFAIGSTLGQHPLC